MTGTVIFIAIGLFLAGLLLSVWRGEGATPDSDPSAAATLADPSLMASRCEQVFEQVVARADWEYVQQHASPEVQRIFLAERKRLALLCLAEIRNQARVVMRAHTAQARDSSQILAAQEVRVAFEYFKIRLECGLVGAILVVGGPLALHRMAGCASRLSEELRQMVRLSLKPVSTIKRSTT